MEDDKSIIWSSLAELLSLFESLTPESIESLRINNQVSLIKIKL